MINCLVIIKYLILYVIDLGNLMNNIGIGNVHEYDFFSLGVVVYTKHNTYYDITR